jgi:hypothetical protein
VPHRRSFCLKSDAARKIGFSKPSTPTGRVMRRAAGLRPDTVVVTSPHATLYADYFHISPGASARGDLASFGFPGVHVRADYDEDFVKALSLCADEAGGPRRNPWRTCCLGRPRHADSSAFPKRGVRRIPGRAHRAFRPPAAAAPRLGECIARTADRLGRRTVLLASGDLSHRLAREGPYGFAPEGRSSTGRSRPPLRPRTFPRFSALRPSCPKKPASAAFAPSRSWRAHSTGRL